MRIIVIGAIAALFFTLKAQPVHAVEVTWEMTGTINENTGLEGVFVGDPFRVSVTFDSDAALVATQTGGRFEPDWDRAPSIARSGCSHSRKRV